MPLTYVYNSLYQGETNRLYLVLYKLTFSHLLLLLYELVRLSLYLSLNVVLFYLIEIEYNGIELKRNITMLFT